MNKFAIYSPTQGQREDFPVILLSNAVTSENSNAQEWDGEIRSAKLRKPEMVRGVYAVLSTDGVTATIDGDQTALFTSSDTITIYNTDGDYAQHTIVSSAVVSSDTIITTTTSITIADAAYLFLDADVTSNDPASNDFRKVPTPDGNEIMRYSRFVLSDQTERLVAFTSDTIYYWNTVTTTWVDISPAGDLTAETEYWDTDVYGEYLVATNNQDLPIQWDGDTAGVFEYMDTQLSETSSDFISKAKYIKAFRNYVFLGYVTYNTGSIIYPSSVAWSNIGEGVSTGGFRQDTGKDAGTAYISGDGDISGGFGEWQGYLCIFKRASQRKMWYVGGAIPFNQDQLNPAVGCVAPGSVINDKDGNLFYYGTDKNFREVSYGNVSKALVKTTRDLNPELLGLMRSTYIAEYDEIWWAVAYGNASTANNKVLVFKAGKWEEREIPVTAFGSYTRQTTYTWDTWPFATWNDIGWDSWDTADANTDFPVDLCSDANGNTYEVHGAYTDDGVAYESFFVVSTDMTGKQSLNFYKRMLQMYLYFNSNGAGSEETANISIKRDTEANFQSLGSVILDGTEKIIRKRLAVDMRARNFELKIGATNKYNFIGVEFEYVPVGAR
jgi:hypothetical protein